MSDIRNEKLFMAGRWKWTAGGYERHLPSGCGIGDIDGFIEINSIGLFIEAKEHYLNPHHPDRPITKSLVQVGQRRALTFLAGHDDQECLVLFGCAARNDPMGIIDVGDDWRVHDWRHMPIDARRTGLRNAIHHKLGLPTPPPWGRRS